MTKHDDGYFDAAVAATYDDPGEAQFDADVIGRTVDVLAGLARGGRALEFAIGTGRIAVPLAARGIEVHGIDISNAMVDRLRAKPGGAVIGVTIGDIATARVPGTFSLAYLVFNTVMNLTTQSGQVACFRNAARHLEPSGRFVIECMVPELQRLAPGEAFVAGAIGSDAWSFDEYDVATQGLTSHHLSVVDGRLDRLSIPFRYVWPAELDLMAELAGMHLVERSADWTGAAFTSESPSHVSVWELPGS